MKKRNIDRVVRGKRKHHLDLIPEPDWSVTITGVTGDKTVIQHDSEEKAKTHADWLFSNPTVAEARIAGPKYGGKLHYPTESDVLVGRGMVDLLESGKVLPSLKFDIARWMDSKAWGGSLNDQPA